MPATLYCACMIQCQHHVVFRCFRRATQPDEDQDDRVDGLPVQPLLRAAADPLLLLRLRVPGSLTLPRHHPPDPARLPLHHAVPQEFPLQHSGGAGRKGQDRHCQTPGKGFFALFVSLNSHYSAVRLTPKYTGKGRIQQKLIKVRNETRQNLTQVRIVVLTGLATEK